MTQNITYGYIPSQLDGTEYQADFGDFKIPTSFTYQPIMPPVRDQGRESTCVCQTLTGMLDVQRNSETGIMNKCNEFSIYELYNQRSNKPGEGMMIKEGLSILKHKGLNGEKIDNYAMCTSVAVAKQALVSNGPLAIGMMVYNNGTDRYWEKRGARMGGHCTMLVGFDENGFIMRNSWGTSYGNQGYIKLPFKDFEKYVMECWTITL